MREIGLFTGYKGQCAGTTVGNFRETRRQPKVFPISRVLPLWSSHFVLSGCALVHYDRWMSPCFFREARGLAFGGLHRPVEALVDFEFRCVCRLAVKEPALPLNLFSATVALLQAFDWQTVWGVWYGFFFRMPVLLDLFQWVFSESIDRSGEQRTGLPEPASSSVSRLLSPLPHLIEQSTGWL